MFVFPGHKPYLSHKETIPKTLVSSAPPSGETGFPQITCASLAKGLAYPYQKRGKGGAKLRLFLNLQNKNHIPRIHKAVSRM